MKLLTIQTGIIKDISWEGSIVKSAIFKEVVDQPLFLGELGLAGDRQAEEKYHGGVDKAVYAYSIEYYPIWESYLGRDLKPGSFGENLLTTGILDKDISPGDIYQIGEVVVQAVSPRIPCFKIGMRHNQKELTARFIQECKYGVYFKVLKTGTIQGDCPIELIEKSDAGFSIEEMSNAYAFPKKNGKLITKILAYKPLEEQLRQDFEKLTKRIA